MTAWIAWCRPLYEPNQLCYSFCCYLIVVSGFSRDTRQPASHCIQARPVA